MLIVLKKTATEADAELVKKKIADTGLKPLYLPGEEKVVLGAIGDERKIAKLELQSLDFVERVVPVLKPYKLCNREFKSEKAIVKVRDVEIGGNEVTQIAGPCSVESEEQIVSTAHAVKKAGAKILRGGACLLYTSDAADE